ncbi:hypothetical protein F5879DRAFT_648058 [Lentinula edodes]|nr:hypothetical protein F5879DRAFT_648058 [Lentinula edodes]
MPMYGFAHHQVFPQPPVSTSCPPVQPVQNPTLGKKNSSQQPNTVPGHLSAAGAGLNTVPSINIVPPTPVLGSVVLPSRQTVKSTSPSEYQLAGKTNPLLSPNTTPESWDGWLDGNLEADFTWEELAQTGDLRVHWARKDYGSRAGVGNAFAEHWYAGKKNTRSCLGVISCANEQCLTIIRPHSFRRDSTPTSQAMPMWGTAKTFSMHC